MFTLTASRRVTRFPRAVLHVSAVLGALGASLFLLQVAILIIQRATICEACPPDAVGCLCFSPFWWYPTRMLLFASLGSAALFIMSFFGAQRLASFQSFLRWLLCYGVLFIAAGIMCLIVFSKPFPPYLPLIRAFLECIP